MFQHGNSKKALNRREKGIWVKFGVEYTGVEPVTSALRTQRSGQLS